MQILLKRLNGVIDTFDIPAGYTHAQLYAFVSERQQLPPNSFLLHKGNHNIANDSNPVQEDGVIFLLMHVSPASTAASTAANASAGGRKSRSRRSRSKSRSKRRHSSKSRSRGDAIAAVMRGKGMTLGAASAYVKRHGLW